MSNKLKQSLIEKTTIKSSSDFDSRFFEKLEKQKKHRGVFTNWLTWTISGCATASVLFIAINNYRVPATTFNHQEYIDTALEIQSAINEDALIDETSDLTSASDDEI